MQETAKSVLDYGISGAILIGLAFLFVKYLPELINIFIDRLKKRDYRDDLFLRTIENNSRVIENNTAVINKNLTNQELINNNIQKMNDVLERHDKRAEVMSANIDILKDRR